MQMQMKMLSTATTTHLYTRLQDLDCVCKSAAGSGIAFGPVAIFENCSNGAPPSIVSKNS